MPYGPLSRTKSPYHSHISRGHDTQEILVAVGTLVTQRPPHRSVHAALPHTALASGDNAEAHQRIKMHFPYPLKRTVHAFPALRPGRVLLKLAPLPKPWCQCGMRDVHKIIRFFPPSLRLFDQINLFSRIGLEDIWGRT